MCVAGSAGEGVFVRVVKGLRNDGSFVSIFLCSRTVCINRDYVFPGYPLKSLEKLSSLGDFASFFRGESAVLATQRLSSVRATRTLWAGLSTESWVSSILSESQKLCEQFLKAFAPPLSPVHL